MVNIMSKLSYIVIIVSIWEVNNSKQQLNWVYESDHATFSIWTS